MMMQSIKNYFKVPLLLTLTLTSLAITGLFLFKGPKSSLEHWSALLPRLNPSQGNAHTPDHLLIFIDPNCPMCSYFYTEVYEEIEKRWIATGKLRCTMIPIKSPVSSPLFAKIMLALNTHAPYSPEGDYVHTQLKVLFRTEEWDEPTLLSLLKAHNDAKIATKIEQALTNPLFDKILAINRQAMEYLAPSELYTPFLLLNGKEVTEPTIAALETALGELSS